MDTIPAKTIVTRAKSPDAWFGMDYTMNLYRGCCHGCIYCDSRSSCYGIPDFDRVCVKENCLALIRDELRRKVRTGVVGTGAMSDPYNPFERDTLYTRHALELVSAFAFGVAVTTKSDLITRDTDILLEIASQSPVLCLITITTVDDALAALLEPHAPRPSARLRAIEALSRAGIFTGVLLTPVLPFLEDQPEAILRLLQASADAGARFVYPLFGVTLRQNQRAYFLNRLRDYFPEIRLQYLRRYGSSYYCASPHASDLMDLLTNECTARGLLFDMKAIIRAYRRGYASRQLRLDEI